MCASITDLVANKKNMEAWVLVVFSLVEHVVWFALGTGCSIEARGHSKDRTLLATGVGVESHTHVVSTFALVLLAHTNASKDEDEDELGAPDPSHG